MRFVEWADSKTRNLSVVDIALVKWSCIVGGVLAARLVPSLQRVDPKVLGVLTLGLAVKPAVTALTSKAPPR